MCHTHYPDDTIQRISVESRQGKPQWLVVTLSDDDCTYRLPVEKIATLAHHVTISEYQHYHDQGPVKNAHINPNWRSHDAYGGCHVWKGKGAHEHGWEDLDHAETDGLNGELEFSVTYCNCHVNIPMLLLNMLIVSASQQDKDIMTWEGSELVRVHEEAETIRNALLPFCAETPLETAGHEGCYLRP